MEVGISHVDQLKESIVEEKEELTDLVEKSSVDDPDIVFLFPATQKASSEDFEEKVEKLDSSLDCPLVGVSVGGFATHRTEGGLKTRGAAAVFLKGVDFEIERVEDAWTSNKEEIREKLKGPGTTVTFETGNWGPSERSQAFWSRISDYSTKILSMNLLGKNDAILSKFRERLKENRVGYSNFFEARMELLIEGEDIINFSSGDMGDFREGYEIQGSEMTSGKSAICVNFSEKFEEGSAAGTPQAFENDRVLESFDNLKHSNQVAYSFDGKTLTEIGEDYPVQRDVGRGNFMYYFIVEEDKAAFAIPINADLDIVVSYTDFDNVEKVHLARAPSFSEYEKTFEDMLEELEGLPHISINPPQVVSFRSKVNEFVEKAQEELDEFIMTTDNAQRVHDRFEYNFPNYMIYEEKP
jgi:hypothetical protein